ncbi:nuclear transport factor 2 family protein [Amycolatopsis sp. NPDC088138]|uniref:nuclear transport factor 2 family protein n=1 Tax=Amycolatopsis sp. NPDC088138 TaxID=3363938 RepID=UPI003801570F
MRHYYRLVDRGDVEGLIALFDTDAVYHRPGYQPLHGHEELRHFYLEDRVIRDGRHDLDTVIASDDEVAVHGSFRGMLHDGNEVDVRFADFFTFQSDGSFSRRDTFFFAPLV